MAVSLRAVLAAYDEEVRDALGALREVTAPTERLRLLRRRVLRTVAVHDAVLAGALCPLLESLPGGPAVAERLRRGCEERAALLSRFEDLTRHVAVTSVYPVVGDEVEEVLAGLDRSLHAHLEDETSGVADCLEAASASVDPDAVAAAMALEARRAPTRSHRGLAHHPRSRTRRALARWQDRLDDWSDTHWGWAASTRALRSPRPELVTTLQRQAAAASPSVRGLLIGYDRAIDQIIAELPAARDPSARAGAVRRLGAAVGIHDAVVGAVLCPLLAALPAGRAATERLGAGCHERAPLLRRLETLAGTHGGTTGLLEHPEETEQVLADLVASFNRHEREQTLDVASVLEAEPPEAFRTLTSPFEDVMWPWHSEGPAALALHMALWAEGAPTRPHAALEESPRSWLLHRWYHLTDYLSDRWHDTWLERYLFPDRPARPFSSLRPAARHDRH